MLKRKFLNSCGLINAALSDQDILSQINKLIIPKIKKPQTRIEKNEYLAIRVKPSIKQTSPIAKDSHCTYLNFTFSSGLICRIE